MKIGRSVVVVLLLAFLLRLVGLNQSLWLDEATTAKVVQQYNYGQILTQFSPNDFHPPLYYLLMKFWTNIFGYSEVALRMPSVLASLLTGWVIYMIKLMKSKKSDALWTAGFFLFNPLIVYYSQEARMYSMATLFLTLFIFYQLRISDKGYKTKDVLLTNVFGFLSFMTFYGSVFLVVSFYAYLLFKKHYKMFFTVLPSAILASLLLHPLFFEQLKNSGEVLRQLPNWSITLGKANLQNLLLIPTKFTSGRISFEPKILYYAVAGIWASFVTYFSLRSIFKPKLLLLNILYLFPLVLGFGISFYKPLLQFFRFIYVIPFMCILLTLGADKRWQRVALISGFVLFSLIYTYIPSFHREDWKSLVAALPSSNVCALPSSFDPLHYYNPKLKTSDARARCTGNDEIVFVPYASEIYGFDYVKHFGQKGYTLTKEVSFRGVTYEQWSKK